MAQHRNLPIAVFSVIKPVVQEDGVFGLRNAAAARVGEEPKQKIAGDEGADDGRQHAPPGRAAGRVHAGGEASGEEDERDDNQTDECADDEAESQRHARIAARPQLV
jgi:hypothetical protein